MLFNSPRMIATAWDSLGLQWDKVQRGGALNVLSGVAQSMALILPLAGFTYTTSRVVGKMSIGAWGWSDGSALRRTLVVASSAAMALVAAYVLYPNGEYRPIQANERGTVQGAVAQISAVPTGRPALTEKRQRDLGGAPTVRSGGAPLPTSDGSTKPAPASPTPAATTGATSTPTATEPAQTTSTPTATETTPTDTSTVPAETTTVPPETTTTPTTTTTP
jgi:hypothetical protein